MTLATPLIELALDSRPKEAPNWVDVTGYCDAFSTNRGRADEFGRIEAGRFSAQLDNSDGRWNPWNSGGPYYGDLKRQRRLRISAVWEGDTYRLGMGYVERWPQDRRGPLDARVNLPAVDALAILAQMDVVDAFDEELSGTRVNNILDAIGWTTGGGWVLGSSTNGILGDTTILTSSAGRAVSDGVSYVQAKDYSDRIGAKALDTIREAEAAEDGLLYVRADGSVTFVGRMARLTSTSRAIFGDGGGDELPYVDALPTDDGPLYNDVRVTVTDGDTYSAEDLGSQADYFLSSLPLQAALGTGRAGMEAQARADWYVTRHKDPLPRFRTIELDPQGDDRLWPQVLARDIGDRITVRCRPPGCGLIEQDCHIERISHQFRLGDNGIDWRTAWELSPANSNTYWVLGQSVLGDDTRLAY